MVDGPTQFAHRNLPLLLLQARENMLTRFRPILKAHGVTEQQWRIIRAMQDTGPLEPHQLVDLCCISSPSLTGILARMDDMGLIERERMNHDQRRIRVSLTAKGSTLVSKMVAQIDAAYGRIEADTGHVLIEDLYQALSMLNERIRTR